MPDECVFDSRFGDADDPVEPVSLATFKDTVRVWAEIVGVAPRDIHLKAMKRKWASCSSKGRLTFDLTLLRQPAAFRDEVIVHELLHLKVPNHSKLFYSLLRAHLAQNRMTSSRHDL